ncbi:hypothetical protein M0R45_007003 [Rubus argutus]|uniref:Uncharacterized protein n=1 Tax=Rubus argutus TaxID=59490 RepID=A0AAW1YTH3_RUBAR
MALLKCITPYAIAVLLLAVFYVPPPLGKTPYEYLRAFWLYSGHLPSVQATRYDYLMFVVQWPFATCANQSCTYEPLPDFFTIHGMWPSNKRDPQPAYCNGTLFNCSEMNQQPQLKSDLNVSWPNLINISDNMGFWGYEYNKHGTCCGSIYNQTAYFRTAHQNWSKYRVEMMFRDAGYRPGNSYTLTELQAAIKTKTTKNPALRCKNLTKSGGGYLLWEVVICYDPKGIYVMDCEPNLSRCSKVKPILYRDRQIDELLYI